MRRKHVVAGAAAIAALAGGAAGAVAATSGGDKATEQSVLDDAAHRLGVSPTDLRNALSQAENAQIDAAVKAGKLTQAQADAIKQHRQQDGTVLGFGHRERGPGGFGGRGGHGGGRFLLRQAAKAIGLTPRGLIAQLRGGKTLEAVAKANGKSLADVEAAVKQAATTRLDAALKAGRITQAQHDERISELDPRLARLGDLGRFGRMGDHPWRDDDGPGAPPTP